MLMHLESRQLEGLLSAFLPSGTLSPITRDKIPPQFRNEAIREIIRYGPLTVFGTAVGSCPLQLKDAIKKSNT
jgi:hypothetical protein